jgi:hypothetical protein
MCPIYVNLSAALTPLLNLIPKSPLHTGRGDLQRRLSPPSVAWRQGRLAGVGFNDRRACADLPLPKSLPVNGEGLKKYRRARLFPLSPRAGKGGQGDRGKPRPAAKNKIPTPERRGSAGEVNRRNAPGKTRIDAYRGIGYMPLLGHEECRGEAHLFRAKRILDQISTEILRVDLAFHGVTVQRRDVNPLQGRSHQADPHDQHDHDRDRQHYQHD